MTHKKYNLPHPFNVRYSRARALARYYGQEWAWTPETWYRVWQDSGVAEHMGKQVHQFCMVRVENMEAHGAHNCIIIPRRMHFKKLFYEYIKDFPKTDYDPRRHAYYVPPETLERYPNDV